MNSAEVVLQMGGSFSSFPYYHGLIITGTAVVRTFAVQRRFTTAIYCPPISGRKKRRNKENTKHQTSNGADQALTCGLVLLCTRKAFPGQEWLHAKYPWLRGVFGCALLFFFCLLFREVVQRFVSFFLVVWPGHENSAPGHLRSRGRVPGPVVQWLALLCPPAVSTKLKEEN